MCLGMLAGAVSCYQTRIVASRLWSSCDHIELCVVKYSLWIELHETNLNQMTDANIDKHRLIGYACKIRQSKALHTIILPPNLRFLSIRLNTSTNRLPNNHLIASITSSRSMPHRVLPRRQRRPPHLERIRRTFWSKSWDILFRRHISPVVVRTRQTARLFRQRLHSVLCHVRSI